MSSSASPVPLDNRAQHLRELVLAVRGRPDHEVVYVDSERGNYHTGLAVYSFMPIVLYDLLRVDPGVSTSLNTMRYINDLFSSHVVQMSLGMGKGREEIRHPLTVKEVKQLLITNALVNRETLQELLRRQDDIRELKELSEDELQNLYNLANPLSRPEVFCFEQDSFGPHSEGFGSTHEGRKRLVSVIMQLMEKQFHLKNPTGFWHTFLMRGIGADTPIGTVYPTPDGMFQIVKVDANTGCKIVYLTPISQTSKARAKVIVLPTQITPYSFRQNLQPCIGVAAVRDVLPYFEASCKELGIDQAHPADFYGYSLGGLQTWILFMLYMQYFNSYFIINNPGIPEEWQKTLIQALPLIFEQTEARKFVKGTCIQTVGDGIRDNGGTQIWDKFRQFQESIEGTDKRFPIDFTFYRIGERHLMQMGNGLNIKYCEGNLFDVIAMMILSFYGVHSLPLFLEGDYLVDEMTNRQDDPRWQILQDEAKRTKLGIEKIRLVVVKVLDWIRQQLAKLFGDSAFTINEARWFRDELTKRYPSQKELWEGIQSPKPESAQTLYVPEW